MYPKQILCSADLTPFELSFGVVQISCYTDKNGNQFNNYYNNYSCLLLLTS